MAHFNLPLSLFFTSIFVVFITLFAAPPPSNDIITDICKKTRNPSFCSGTLNPAHTTDLKKLAGYALNLAGAAAGRNLRLAQSLAAKTADRPLKDRYTACTGHYDEAVGNIQTAQKYLATGDFNGVNVVTSGAMEDVGDCRDEFKQAPADTSTLLHDGDTLEDICSIVLVLANLLPQSNPSV